MDDSDHQRGLAASPAAPVPQQLQLRKKRTPSHNSSLDGAAPPQAAAATAVAQGASPARSAGSGSPASPAQPPAPASPATPTSSGFGLQPLSAASFASGVGRAIRYAASLDGLRGVSGVSASTVHAAVGGDDDDAGAGAERRPAGGSSIFPLFLTGGSRVASKRGVGTHAFRSLSNGSTASIDSLGADASTSLLGGQPPPPPPDPPTNAEDEEDALLLARLEQHSRHNSIEHTLALASSSSAYAAANGSPGQRPTAANWIASQLQASFQSVRESLGGAGAGNAAGTGQGDKPPQDEIDWDFWGRVINDYEDTLRKQPRQFTKKLHQGIPEPIRGMMWQLMANSKSESLEEEYLQLLTRNTRHEKIIQRDLARTFPSHEYFKDANGPGQTSLFNILRAYSIYDQEIGYCQGMGFVVGPLLLNMPEEQAFCLCVRLMNDYGFRDLFSPKMIGLQLRNFQFDKLIEEQFPAVARHLEKQDIRSTMYASQWFMTLFAYRFPLEMVFRILDIVFAEGPESVLRFAVALVKHNADTILTLDFEPLLDFLKSGLFDMYITNINKLIADASAIRVSKAKLDRWTAEFNEMMRRQSPEVMEAEAVKVENRRLVDSYRKLEANYELLNREHVDLANKLLEETAERERATERVADLEQQVTSLKSILASDRNVAEEAVRSEMAELATKNVELVKSNAELQEDIAELQARLNDTLMRLAAAESDREELRRKLDNMRKALGI
ncbi:GTPase-activating protein [Polyrhizophydium stewartii]|uniref:GTPase-activating protein n=1 Tax=Polyrhizophydium stewartii TaxID=2732419 RepID=A0ABR4MX89_9FUNG